MDLSTVNNAVSDALNGGQTYNTAADILNAIQNGTLPTSGPAIDAAMQQVASNGLAPQNTYYAPSSAPSASRRISYSSPSGQSFDYTPTNNTALPAGANDVFSFLARNNIDQSILSDPSSGIYANLKASGYDPSVINSIQAAFAPAPTPAPTPTPTPSGTPLSNITAPQFVGTSAPGAVGTTYGQASGDMISAAQQANPALSQALISGNALVNYDADTGAYNLIDKTTGSPIAGNYQVQVGPNGTGINIPSGNGMIQVTAQTDQSGAIAPITAANVQNVGLNRGAGGFAGGPDTFMATAGPVIAAVFPATAPYILAYNSASAANKGQYGAALINALGAAGVYAGQNPTSQIGQMVNSAIDAVTSSLPQSVQDLINTPSTPTAPATPTTPTTPTDTTPTTPAIPTTPQIGDTTGLGSTNYSVAPTGSTGTGFNVQQGTGLNLFNTSGVNPNTGLVNGLGLQAPGSANLSSMGGGQGLTVSTNMPGGTNTLTGQPLGTALNNLPGGTTPTPGVIGATGTTPVGTGGLPVNPATGAAIGTALNNVSTGVTTPSPIITNTGGNVVGTPPGQNTSTGVLPAAAATVLPQTGLTAAQIAAAASAAAALANSKTITNANNAAASTQAAAGQNVQDYLQKAYQTQAGNVQGVQNNLANLYAQQQTGTSNVESLLGNLYANQQGANLGYQTAGNAAAQTLASPGSQQYFTNQFNNQDLNAQLAPNYAFQLQQGMGQARNAANVGGGLLSGNTLQGLNTYAQNYAQGAYQNAFTNYQNQRQNIYSNLANQAGIGQTANTTLANLGANLAGQYNQANQNLGNVGANIGATNAGAVQGLGALSGQLANTYGNVTTGLAASQAGLQTANAVNQTNLLSNLANNATLAYLA